MTQLPVNEEWAIFRSAFADLGGGSINIARIFDSSIGSGPVDGIDLYSVALHEIGHGLGMSLANNSFIVQAVDGSIHVTAPRPFAGTTVPLTSSQAHASGLLLNDMVMGGVGGGERADLSALDMGQLSGSDDLSMDLVTPEPATLLLFGTTAAGLGLARSRQRRRKQQP